MASQQIDSEKKKTELLWSAHCLAHLMEHDSSSTVYIQLRKADLQWLFKMLFWMSFTHSINIYYVFYIFFPRHYIMFMKKYINNTILYMTLVRDRSVNRNPLYNITSLIPKEISCCHTTSVNSIPGFYTGRLLLFLGHWLLIKFALLFSLFCIATVSSLSWSYYSEKVPLPIYLNWHALDEEKKS